MVSISIDELAMGFTIGLLHLSFPGSEAETELRNQECLRADQDHRRQTGRLGLFQCEGTETERCWGVSSAGRERAEL